MRRRAPQAAPPNQPLYPSAAPQAVRPPPSPAAPAATAATSPYSAAGGFSTPSSASSLYPTRPAQQQYGFGSGAVGGGADYGASRSDDAKDWQQTALMHGRWTLRGWHDAARPAKVWDMISSDAHLRASVVRSLLVNIPVLLGLLFLKQLILPLLSHASPSGRGATARPGLLAWALGNTFFWEAVGVAVVVLVNGKWQGLIAERAFGGGRAAGTGGKGLGGGSAGSSLATRTIILLDYVVVTSVLHLVPYVGWPLATAYTLWVNAYYCFAHAWAARGFSLGERVAFLQTRWAYLAGFGTPLTLATTLPFLPPLALTGLYATFFPVFLILASVSDPVPSASGSFSNLPLAGGEEGAGASDGSGGGGEAGLGWRVPALEGARWGVAVWERFGGELLGDGAGGADGFGAGSRHKRRGSRFA